MTNVTVTFHVSSVVDAVVISLLFKIVINPFLFVISNPDIVFPFPSVTVLYVKLVKPVTLVNSVLFPSFIVKSISGVSLFWLYTKVLSDIFKYR